MANEIHRANKTALDQILEANISVETLPASDVNQFTIIDIESPAQRREIQLIGLDENKGDLR